MRRFASLTAGMLVVAGACGQSLTTCIDPDALHGLLLPGMNPISFNEVVPPELATFKAPATFTWIGSADRRIPLASAGNQAPATMDTVTAGYRSSQPLAASRAAAIDALAAGGWTPAPERVPLVPRAFATVEPNPVDRYCLDGDAAAVSANTLDGVNYVAIFITRGSSRNGTFNNGCNPVTPPPGFAFFTLDPLHPFAQYLPRLEAPLDPVSKLPVEMRSGSSNIGDNPSETIVRFSVKDSPGNVASHFARQMAQQGWIADASWDGATTVGSTWSKTSDTNVMLHATLSVAQLDDIQFAATLRVIRTQ